MDEVKVPYIDIRDHLNTQIRFGNSIAPLADYVVGFTYVYKEGEENDEGELKIAFDDIHIARLFLFRPGINYHVTFGYTNGDLTTRDLVIDKINKKIDNSQFLITLTLIPLAEYEGRVLPMDITTAEERMMMLIDRNIEFDIKFPYDRKDIVLTNIDINSPKKPTDFSNLYYTTKEENNSPPKKSALFNYFNPDTKNSNFWYTPGGVGFPSQASKAVEVSPKYSIWNNLELVDNILSWTKDFKTKLGLAEVHARDGKVIVQDRNLEAKPIISLSYISSEILISWEIEESDIEIETESEYQAQIEQELKKQDIVKISTLKGDSFQIVHVGNTVRAVNNKGDNEIVNGEAILMKVYKEGEDYYTATEEEGYAKKISPEYIEFLEKQFNFSWTNVILKENLIINKDFYNQCKPITSEQSDFNIENSQKYWEIIWKNSQLPTYEQAKIDAVNTKFVKPLDLRGTIQMDLTRYAHSLATSEDIHHRMGPFIPLSEPVTSVEDILAQENITDYTYGLSSEGDLRKYNSNIFSDDAIITLYYHPNEYSLGYIRKRIAREVKGLNPLELKTIADSYLNDTLEAELHKKKLTLVIEGNPSIEISQTIKFTGLDEYDSGIYYIISSEHKIDSSGYTTKIEALKVPEKMDILIENIQVKIEDMVAKRKLEIFNKTFKKWEETMAERYETAKSFGYEGTQEEYILRETYKHAPHAIFEPKVLDTQIRIIEIPSSPTSYKGTELESTNISTMEKNNTNLPIGIKAMLDTLAWAEGTLKYGNNNGYDVFFTGKLLSDYNLNYLKHPNKSHSISTTASKKIVSTACGRYQFLYKTWEELANTLGLPDFSPESQDLAAVELLKRRKVYNSLEDGDIEEALDKKTYYNGTKYSNLALEWASFPNGPWGQNNRSREDIIEVYNARLEFYKNLS